LKLLANREDKRPFKGEIKLKHDARWTVRKVAARLELVAPMVYRKKHFLPAFKYTTLDSPSGEVPVGADVDDSGWETIEPGSYWGTWVTDYAMRTEFEVPADWDDDALVALYLPMGNSGDFSHPESLAYIDGEAYASCDRHHHEIVLPAKWCDGKKHRLALCGWTGLGGFANNEPRTKLFMRDCAVVQIHQTTRDFVAAVRVALGVVKELDDNDPVKSRLLNALNDAFNVVDTRSPLGDDFYATVGAALETLQSGIKIAGEPMDVDIVAAGHAHIDVAWLWTLAQTRRKCARTFSNVLRLMERFPDYHFTQSQPQLYQYVSEDYPEIFEEIRKRVEEGRWELIGGSWVEQDCNASGAESLARQFVLGRRYFRDNFGDRETKSFWLPDTFGYPWALPQLMKLAGLKYFITHKMSWNQYNRMPYQSFWWKGIDGSEILTHFMTTPEPGADRWGLPYATTYNGDVSPKQIVGTWTNYLHKEAHSELMTAFGHGDGGGGPTEEMLENAIQMENHPGAPRVRFGTIREFLEKLENESGDKLPDWHGELYFEYHRGTYTSQARNKRNNRKNEYLLHDAEFLAALAALNDDYAYPQEDINQAWELVCLNQFHDILPGSSIGQVYEDSDNDYKIIQELGEKVRDGALEALAAQLPSEATMIAANPTSFGGRLVGLLPEQLADGNNLMDLTTGKSLVTQVVEAGTLVELPDTQPYHVRPLGVTGTPADAKTSLSVQVGDEIVLENDLLRVEFNKSGDITRVFDKAVQREVLPEGERANVFLAFEDRPMNFDAWDIDIFYNDRQWEAEAAHELSMIEDGPLRVGLLIKRKLRSSQIVQRVYLYHDSPRLDFDTWIDWHEHEILLKVAFPVDVFSPTATYDIQWGNIERPTHHNTSWDWARFEVNAYKWADLSEGNYGVSLLNDCKYGYDIRDNIMRLTLLKSATSPDPNADQGEHLVTYSLFPHEGDWRSGTVAASYDLNNPLIVRSIKGQGTGATLEQSFVSVNRGNVIIETVKQAEDGDGLIVRLYENERSRGKVILQTGFALKAAYICNLLEDNETELAVDNGAVTLDITPYQIITVRLIQA
jgi:alpha-mannosidase